METLKIKSKLNSEIELTVMPGHFSSDRFHVNYYIEMSKLKTRVKAAKKIAAAMAQQYIKKVDIKLGYNSSLIEMGSLTSMGANVKPVDTIICMDGCEVIGAYLADEFMKVGVPNKTQHKSVYVVTPEFDNRGQMVVRKNTKDLIKGRNVLVVLASAMSGQTITKAIGTILAYGGKVTGLSVIFGNIEEVDGYPVYSVFSKDDIPNFTLSDPDDCPDCKAGKKLDAVVNSYGYELL